MKFFTRKKLFILEIVFLVYLFLLIPLLIFNLKSNSGLEHNKYKGGHSVMSLTTEKNTCPNTSRDVIIGLDTSIVQLDQAKKTALSLTSLLSQDTNNKIGFVLFNKDATISDQLTNNFKKIQSDIASASAGTGSCIQCAIDQANLELTKNRRDGMNTAIILVTDGHVGYTNQGLKDPTTAQQQSFQSANSAHQTTNASVFSLAIDSDANIDFLTTLSTVNSGSYYLNPTQDQLSDTISKLAQVQAQGTIKGYAFNDQNHNQYYDPGEYPLSDISIKLTEQNQTTPDQTVLTDKTGLFTIGNICNGTYKLSASVPDGWVQIFPTDQQGYTVSIINNNTVTDNFALAQGSRFLSPTSTPKPTELAFTVLLDGIGAATNNNISNTHPLHSNRTMIATLYTLDGQISATVSGIITFDPNTGAFLGTIDTPTHLDQGNYIIAVRVDHYVTNTLPGTPTIIPQQMNKLLPVDLLAGDTDGDGKLDIRDYNILLDCYNAFRPPTNCDPAKKRASDLNDDGQVNQEDYNLFLDEIKKQPQQQ